MENELLCLPEGTRLLLVDDHDDSVNLLRAAFGRDGVRLEATRNGVEALALCERDSYDAVLMDIRLEGDLDGYEVTRRLRARGFAAPIVAVTGMATDECARLAREAGCDEHLRKPVELDVLKRCLLSLLAARASRGER